MVDRGAAPFQRTCDHPVICTPSTNCTPPAAVSPRVRFALDCGTSGPSANECSSSLGERLRGLGGGHGFDGKQQRAGRFGLIGRTAQLHGRRSWRRDCCFPQMRQRGGVDRAPAGAWSSSAAGVMMLIGGLRAFRRERRRTPSRRGAGPDMPARVRVDGVRRRSLFGSPRACAAGSSWRPRARGRSRRAGSRRRCLRRASGCRRRRVPARAAAVCRP